MVSRAPDFSAASRASAQGSIAALEKQLAAQGPAPVRRPHGIDRRTGRRRAGFSESRLDFKIRSQRFQIANQQKQKDIAAARARIATLNRKEKTSRVQITADREERIESFSGGPSGAALARAKKRGQTKLVTKTASRRGRKGKKTITIKKIAGRSCTARTSQDVGLLTSDEAACELESKKINTRSFVPGTGTVSINEREARLIVKLAPPKPKRGRKATRSRLDDFGIAGLVGQARGGLAPLATLNAPSSFNFETRRIGGRTTGRLVTFKTSKFDGTSQNLLRNRSNFILGGFGDNADFTAKVQRDVRNRESGRRGVSAVSRGRVSLNRTAVFDPFLGRSLF